MYTRALALLSVLGAHSIVSENFLSLSLSRGDELENVDGESRRRCCLHTCGTVKAREVHRSLRVGEREASFAISRGASIYVQPVLFCLRDCVEKRFFCFDKVLERGSDFSWMLLRTAEGYLEVIFLLEKCL